MVISKFKDRWPTYNGRAILFDARSAHCGDSLICRSSRERSQPKQWRPFLFVAVGGKMKFIQNIANTLLYSTVSHTFLGTLAALQFPQRLKIYTTKVGRYDLERRHVSVSVNELISWWKGECLSCTDIRFRHFNYLIQVHPFRRKGSINKSQVLPQSGLVFDWNGLIPAHALVDNYQLHLSTGTWFCLKGPSHSHMTTQSITEKQDNIFRVLRWYHEVLGHCGATRLYDTIRQVFLFPGMKHTCDTFQCSYPDCQKQKTPRNSIRTSSSK